MKERRKDQAVFAKVWVFSLSIRASHFPELGGQGTFLSQSLTFNCNMFWLFDFITGGTEFCFRDSQKEYDFS